MNGSFTLVEKIQKEKGDTANIFVKDRDEFIRVTTNMKKRTTRWRLPRT
ncbi:hypothetical protein [Methylobacterium nodulans]|nr:hypothetical protein [Methylobacterium nodulans]